MAQDPQTYFENLQGFANTADDLPTADDPRNKSWDSIVAAQIANLADRYGLGESDSNITNILSKWHRQVTSDYKHSQNFAPHVNGFYMIFMVHGTWYDDYLTYVQRENSANLSEAPDAKEFGGGLGEMTFKNPNSYFNMLATDIDVPDITEEYTSVSSRLRNSFIPSRDYFVSDFTISYIENINLDVIRYHEAWHKYLNLIRRGEHIAATTDIYAEARELSTRSKKEDCSARAQGYFSEVPYANAIWVAVFRPFTTEIQLLIKLVGVMPVTLPLKQVVGNRSASKMTVLNMSYKAADMFYKFYNSTYEFLHDDGLLASSFRIEVMDTEPSGAEANF